MRFSAKVSVALATFVAFVCFFGSSTLARADAENEDELINRGVALRKQGDDAGARELFRKAFERFHTPRAAAQLGMAEQALGRWEEAELHVGEALRSPDDPWVKKNQSVLSSDMMVIKNHIARLEILGQPDGAEIVVNGRVVGRLPLPSHVSTSAGEVDVEARAPGYAREVRKLTLAGGQYQRLVMRLQKEVSPAVATAAAVVTPPATTTAPLPEAPPPTVDAPEPTTTNLRPIAKWSALGLAGAGLAVGIVSTVVRADKLDQFKSAHGGGCLEMNGRGVDKDGVAIPECQGPLDTYHSARPWQIAGFVSAGVFAATWLVLTLTEPAASAGGNVARAPVFVCGPTGDLSGAACTLSL